MPDESIPTTWLEKLARYFAINIICHSANDNSEIETVSRKLLNKGTYSQKYTKSRNILITGAGTSYNASKNIPLANQFADELKTAFSAKLQSSAGSKNLLESQLDYLSRAYNLQRGEFETIMLACSRLDNDVVLDSLKTDYDFKHLPNLFFELVAHMFKHRFIDVIINFNFDEILDNAIEEEMTGQEYNSIISDGDLTEEFDHLMFGHRLKKPIYIKPHGTISHPSSLRFNKEHYFALPSRIADTLERLFLGEYADTVEEQEKSGQPKPKDNISSKQAPAKGKQYLTLNFIIAGFGMQSNDLNFILNKALKERVENSSKDDKVACHFFVFDVADESRYLQKFVNTSLFDGLENHFFTSEQKIKFLDDRFNYIPILNKSKEDIDRPDLDKKTSSLENQFHNIFNATKSLFVPDEQSKIRGIERHLIVTELFRKEWSKKALKLFENSKQAVIENRIRSEYYLVARLYVELAILMVHAEGIINISQLKESRFNKYYSLLQQWYDIFDKSLNNPNVEPLKRRTLNHFAEVFKLSKYKNFAKDTYQYSAKNYSTEKIVSLLITALETLTEESKSQGQQNETDPDKKLSVDVVHINPEQLKKYFLLFHDNPDWEIKSTFKEHSLTKFNTVTARNYLHTDLRFNRYRQQFFEKSDWNLVLSLTKRASFLSEEKNVKSNLKTGNKSEKQMLLILADFQQDKTAPNEWKKFKIKDDNTDYNITFRMLHWSLHNQQMHLFLRFDRSQFECIKKTELENMKRSDNLKEVEDFNNKLNITVDFKRGIYYQRRMLSRKANPIYFDLTEDVHPIKADDIKNDLIEMFDVFVNYYSRAKSESAHAIADYKCFVERKYEVLEQLTKE